MDKKSVYCTAPWTGLTIREDGKVRTCCVGQKALIDLHVDNIDAVENSLVLQEIREKMLNGEPDLENCANCIKQESIDGYSSTRYHYNAFYPEFDPEKITLKYIDLRWNNTCNLSCMYCGPWFSSTWNDRLKQNNLKPVKPYQDQLLAWILERAGHVKEITLVGGEPLLMKQNYELLKVLPLDCQINIVTNLSYDLKNLPCLPDLLKRPPEKILWTISAENTNQQFEYVRQGARWDQFERNIKLVYQHWPNNLTLNMVYSMFNALNLLDIVKAFKSCGIQKFNLLPVDGNNNINVSFMPTAIKQSAKTILDQVNDFHYDSLHPDDRILYPFTGINEVLLYLEKNNNLVVIGKADFQKQIKWYDQWSAVKFEDLWPDVVALTEQHLI